MIRWIIEHIMCSKEIRDIKESLLDISDNFLWTVDYSVAGLVILRHANGKVYLQWVNDDKNHSLVVMINDEPHKKLSKFEEFYLCHAAVAHGNIKKHLLLEQLIQSMPKQGATQ